MENNMQFSDIARTIDNRLSMSPGVYHKAKGSQKRMLDTTGIDLEANISLFPASDDYEAKARSSVLGSSRISVPSLSYNHHMSV